MSITEEQYKDLTRYLDNEMSVEEETVFLDRLKNDEQLRHYYDFEVNLRDYLEVSHLERNIPDFSIADLAEKNQLITISGAVMLPKKLIETKKKSHQFRNWVMYAAAACVIGIAGLFVWFYSNRQQKQNIIVKNANNPKVTKNDTTNNVVNNQINYDTTLNKGHKPNTGNTKNLVIHDHTNIKKLPVDSNANLAVNDKQKIVKSRPVKIRNPALDSLMVPTNKKTEENETAMRGDVYGPDYADIVIDNRTNYSVDIYIDGKYRATIAAWNKMTTLGLSGKTKFYAKATFSDGTYYYWGPDIVLTGYKYTWQLNY